MRHPMHGMVALQCVCQLIKLGLNGYVRQVAVAATQGYKLQWLQLRIFISLNCVSGLIVLIHVHLLANTSNFVSGKVV
jgi:hypothetical protein